MTDFLFDESSRERLIEDYLFSGYKPASKSTFDSDQQFARPIEDEDIFGCGDVDQSNVHEEFEQNNLEDQLNFGDKTPPLGGGELGDDNGSSSAQLFGDTSIRFPNLIQDQQNLPTSEIDEIFLDDFSSSSCPQADAQNDENVRPNPSKSYTKNKPPPPPSPAEIKRARLKASILEQVRAKGLKPKTIGTGFSDSGEVEMVLEQDRLVSDTNSKFIFNKLFNNSKKAHDGTPERAKKSWESYSESLRKRICSQKRKIWDTFQQPVDGYNDEEELIELPDDNAEDIVMGDQDEDSAQKDEKEDDAVVEGEDPYDIDKEEAVDSEQEGIESEPENEEDEFEEEEPDEDGSKVDRAVSDEDLYGDNDSSFGFNSDSEEDESRAPEDDKLDGGDCIETGAQEKDGKQVHPFEGLASDDSEDVVKRR